MDKKKSSSWSYKASQKHGKMYGMLLESIQYFVTAKYGETIWNKILEHAGLKNMVFTTHRIYTNETMLQLARSCCHVTNTKTSEEWMCFFGKCFVKFCSHYGYDNLLRVAGRHYCDFLQGLDNIHEMIRFSYPHLQSPSFMVMSENTEGCVLLYQSKRQGFKQYVIGQLKQCAKKFYNVQVNISIIEEVFEDSLCTVKFRIDFDNYVFRERTRARKSSGSCPFSRISCDTFLTVAPFCIIFDNHLQIKQIGKSMTGLLKGERLLGENLKEKFHLRRPLIPFVWEKILAFQRVMFELEYYHDNNTSSTYTCMHNRNNSPSDLENGSSWSPKGHHLSNDPVILRGQMRYMDEWGMVAFLCTPLLANLEGLRTAGLYINDLNMYDNSRDMVMAGWQHVSTLECSIEQQKGKSDQIAENLQMVEQWQEKSDSLLYSMIPKAIAERLKHDEDPIKTCEVFDNVTILFNYMVGFSEICASSTPLKIVESINSVLVLFDNILDKYNVFKVETLGDAVYMIAGGVPDRSPKHAENVAALALEFQETAAVKQNFILKDRVTTRIGMHTGSVVGGVVGRRMPQYCLFGDTVNTASRMQTYSMPGRIHISETCNECLHGTDFVTVFRGTVNVKGKGEMHTYWLAGRAGEERTRKFCEEVKHENSRIMEKKTRQHSSYDLHGMHVSTSYGLFSDIKKRDSLQDVCQGAKTLSHSADDTASLDDSSECSSVMYDTPNPQMSDKEVPVSFEIGSSRSSIKGSDASFELDSPRHGVKAGDVFDVGSPKTSQMSDASFDIGITKTAQVCDVSFEIGSPKRSQVSDVSFKIGSPKSTSIDDSFESNPRDLDQGGDSLFNIVTPNTISDGTFAVDNIELDITEAVEMYETTSPELNSPTSIEFENDTVEQFFDVGYDSEVDQHTGCVNEADITVDIQHENTTCTWELHKGIHYVELDMHEFEPPCMDRHRPHVLGSLCPLPHTHYSRMPPIEELANSKTEEAMAKERKSSISNIDKHKSAKSVDRKPEQELSETIANKTINKSAIDEQMVKDSTIKHEHAVSTNSTSETPNSKSVNTISKYGRCSTDCGHDENSEKSSPEELEHTLLTNIAIEAVAKVPGNEMVIYDSKSSAQSKIKQQHTQSEQLLSTKIGISDKDKIHHCHIETKQTVQGSISCHCAQVEGTRTLTNSKLEFMPSKECRCIKDEKLLEPKRNRNKTFPFSKSESVLCSVTNGDIFDTNDINGNGMRVETVPINCIPAEQLNGHGEDQDSCPVVENLGQDLSRKMRDWQGKGLQFRLSLAEELKDS